MFCRCTGPIFLAVILLVGCAPSGPVVVPVKGQALRGNEPLPNLFINFIPASGRPSWAFTDEQGKFEVEYSRSQKGLLLGSYSLTVRYQPASMQEELAEQAGTSTNRTPAMNAVLEKYGRPEQAMKIEIKGPENDLKLHFD